MRLTFASSVAAIATASVVLVPVAHAATGLAIDGSFECRDLVWRGIDRVVEICAPLQCDIQPLDSGHSLGARRV